MLPFTCKLGGRLWTSANRMRANAFVGCGACGSCGSIWQQSSLSFSPTSITDLVLEYEATDTASILVPAAQPSVGNWTTGTGWSGTGAQGPYTHAAGSAGDLTQALGVVGNYIKVTYTISSRTAGTLTLYAGTTAGTARSTNATFEEILEVVGNTTIKFAADAAFDGTLVITSVENVCRVRWNPLAGSLVSSAYMSQATAAAQPHINGSGLLYYDIGDLTQDVGAATLAGVKGLHDGTGGTLVCVWTQNSVSAGVKYLFDTGGLGAGSTGLQLIRSTTSCNVQLKNGSGIIGSVTIGALSVSTRYIAIVRVGAATIKGRLNASSTESASYSGAPDTGNATSFKVGAIAGSTYTNDMAIETVLVYDRSLTDAECIKLEAYYA